MKYTQNSEYSYSILLLLLLLLLVYLFPIGIYRMNTHTNRHWNDYVIHISSHWMCMFDVQIFIDNTCVYSAGDFRLASNKCIQYQ